MENQSSKIASRVEKVTNEIIEKKELLLADYLKLKLETQQVYDEERAAIIKKNEAFAKKSKPETAKQKRIRLNNYQEVLNNLELNFKKIKIEQKQAYEDYCSSFIEKKCSENNLKSSLIKKIVGS